MDRKTNGEVARQEVAIWTHVQETGFEGITTVALPRNYIGEGVKKILVLT